ncbi:GNAT family N-acetyltransferase [Methylobacterium gossipiicola]|uniref:Acetyltransferase (GNAT) family protein n=1 Tax=Methylobacterium gossipiicola TaxID=582675 RepID=A0A1I2U4Z0_9HYPH|nr:GNAT family N-acetyltransferase [Methylobacterium gossipiicola]SFG72222.1 Acetyltransferase (GNAT) family protein [Methylobacterium gossipiicola]
MGNRYGLEIRSACAADAAGLAVLLAEAGLTLPADTLAERLDAMRAVGGAVLIAQEWGPPSGLVVLHWYRTLSEARLVAQITTLFVGVEQRRRGVGRLLLKSASQAARMAECDMLQIVAPPDLADLDAFCRATGFTPGGPGFVRPLRKGR